MMPDPTQGLILLEAIGIGLLIGIERERNARDAGTSAAAGVRTFTLASLIGGLSQIAGGWPLLAVALGVVGGLRAISHLSQQDTRAGLTTSFALVIVVILGALSIENTVLAAAAGVVVAALLAARATLHDFSRTVLTTVELRDGLIIGVAALVIFPILPNVSYGPGGAINPQQIFLMVLFVMAISATSHVTTRVFGARLGLPLSGFLSGFVSSTATVVAMAKKAVEQPNETDSAAAGATLSSVSSLVQTGAILLLLSPKLLATAAPILIAPTVVSALYGAAFTYRGMRRSAEPLGMELPSRIISVKGAVTFALIVTAILLISALLNERFGGHAVLISAAIAGLVSTSSAAVAMASLVAVGQLAPDQAVVPLAVALSVNTGVRIILVLRRGNVRFACIAAVGMLLTGLAVWGGQWLPQLIQHIVTLPTGA